MKLRKILLIALIIEIALLTCAVFLYGYSYSLSEKRQVFGPSGIMIITETIYVYPYRELGIWMSIITIFLLGFTIVSLHAISKG